MAKNNHRLNVERLEDRLAPANLTLTSLVLVDGMGNPQSAPVKGQQLRFLVNWSGTDLAGGEACPVRITANGFPLESDIVTHAAGNGTWGWHLRDWFIGTSTITITATIDPHNAIAESNESDNTLSIDLTPINPTDLPAKFIQPLGRTPFVDWAINNYADVDPRPGFAADPRGGPYQYDGHDALDAHPFGQDGMDAGFPIYAAADGKVVLMQDGNFDREIFNYSSSGNYLLIDHGNGWDTIYFHFAKDSITVQPGDMVKAGQVIGLMGSSGFSTQAHIHYTARYRGMPVEPEFAPSLYRQNPLPYAGDVPAFVFDTFVTNLEPLFYDAIERASRVSQYGTSQTGNLYFTALTYNVKTPSQTTQMGWKWYRPDGSLENAFPAVFSPANIARFTYWYWFRPLSNFTGTPGTWQFAFELNGVEVSRTPFTIASTGDPAIRITTVMQATGTNLVINNRTTPFDFGEVAAMAPAPTRVFTIQNHGNSTLELSNYQLPEGFEIVGVEPMTIAPGTSTTLTIRMNADTPGLRFGQVLFITNDPEDPVMRFNVTGRVLGTLPAGSPNLQLVDKALGYDHQSLPRRFAPNATLTDSDSANFNFGFVKVDIASGGTFEDELNLRSEGNGPGQISVDSFIIRYGGVIIGSVIGGTSLTASFNNLATPQAVQAVIRNLTYQNHYPEPSYHRRYITIRVEDGTGKRSDLGLAHVTPSGISYAPVIAPIPDLVATTAAPLVYNGSFTDPHGNSWTAEVDYGSGAGFVPLALNPDKTFQLQHTYAFSSPYLITVRILSDIGVSTIQVNLNVIDPPLVSAIGINGNAAQRSRLTSIAITLDSPVDVALFANPAAISLTRTMPNDAATVDLSNGLILTPAIGTATTLTLSFANLSTTEINHGSLADGRWRLAIPSLNYTSTLNDPTLRRLFGDANNDGTVDSADFALFGTAFGGSSIAFDFDNNGIVDSIDFAEFGSRFGVSL